MRRLRLNRILAEGERALDRMTAIEASVIALGDDDLLDLADIFASGETSPLSKIADAEVRRRGLSLQG
jgi:hypothetical protein